MSFSKNKGSSNQTRNGTNRAPITARNIAKIQEQYEKESEIPEKSKTVLNGRVETDGSLYEDFDGETDLEYEFLYSVSDDENGDHYSYEFDAYPAESRAKNSDDSEEYDAKTNACNFIAALEEYTKDNVQDNDKQEYTKDNVQENDKLCSKELKKERVKSAGIIGSEKQKSCLSVRPKSASLAVDKNSKESTKEHSGCESKTEIIKEVAFKDTASAVSKTSNRSKYSSNNKTRGYARRKSVSYDPDLEKASAYIHGGGKNFSRSNTSLSPVKYGMKHLQMNYTETNLETNQTVIFLDLLKNSHQRTHIRGEQIQNIERRLEAKRNNPLYSTSFYENKNIQDPFRRNAKKTARSVAQKKIERKEKIKQMSDEIHTGYVPTQLTMKIADRGEVEDIGQKCRYLRCQTPLEF